MSRFTVDRGQMVRTNGTVVVATPVDIGTAVELKREAAERGLTVAELLRELITEWRAER
jgi:hypothetical protein